MDSTQIVHGVTGLKRGLSLVKFDLTGSKVTSADLRLSVKLNFSDGSEKVVWMLEMEDEQEEQRSLRLFFQKYRTC